MKIGELSVSAEDITENSPFIKVGLSPPDRQGFTVAENSSAPMRADALKNRNYILEVAHEAFAESGLTSLNEIAKRAGVGAGTLYRHFPTREALILAVYQHDIRRLVDSVPHLLAEHTALDAFRLWFFKLADYIGVKHGLGEALHSPAAQEAIKGTYAPVIAAINDLLQACVAEGSVRAGLDATDVLLLMGFLWRVPSNAGGQEQAHRVMEMVLNGLGPTAR